MPKVKVTEAFHDREDGNKLIEKDTVLTVSEERAKKLEGLGLVKREEKPVKNKAEKESAEKE